MSGCAAKPRTNRRHPVQRRANGRFGGDRAIHLGGVAMTFDAESTVTARAAQAFLHAGDEPGCARRSDRTGLDGMLPPGGALAGRIFSRLLGDAHDDPPLAPGTRVGAWRIGGLLGCGGCAIVYLADRADGHFDQQVAIKVVRPRVELIERFRRERQILASLRHPAIARLIDGGEIEGGRLWLAMEPVFGERIDDYARSRALPLDERLALFEAVCEAVAYAHRRQLVHRDIKPANLLVDETGRPRLLDFGIATADDDREDGDHAMTPMHASPEQRAGEVVTFASDLWQLGAVLRGLVAIDEGSDGLVSRRGRGRVRDALSIVIERAMADDPARRHPCVQRLQTEVAAIRKRLPVSSSERSAFDAAAWFRLQVASRAATCAQKLDARLAAFSNRFVRTRTRELAHSRVRSHAVPWTWPGTDGEPGRDREHPSPGSTGNPPSRQRAR